MEMVWGLLLARLGSCWQQLGRLGWPGLGAAGGFDVGNGSGGVRGGGIGRAVQNSGRGGR